MGGRIISEGLAFGLGFRHLNFIIRPSSQCLKVVQLNQWKDTLKVFRLHTGWDMERQLVEYLDDVCRIVK